MQSLANGRRVDIREQIEQLVRQFIGLWSEEHAQQISSEFPGADAVSFGRDSVDFHSLPRELNVHGLTRIRNPYSLDTLKPTTVFFTRDESAQVIAIVSEENCRNGLFVPEGNRHEDIVAATTDVGQSSQFHKRGREA